MRHYRTAGHGWLTLAALAVAALSCALPTTPGSPPAQTNPDQTLTPSGGSSGAELVYYNGVILTQDEARPQAEAVMIGRGHILAVGTDQEVLALAGPEDTRVDLQGAALTPGFIDAHEHRIGDWGATSAYSGPDEIVQASVEQGWTSLDELNLAQDQFEAVRQLDREGRLRLRVTVYLGVNTNRGDLTGDWYSAYQPGAVYSPYLKIAGLKIFDDIAWGTTIFWDQASLNAEILKEHVAGWQIAVHTVGNNSHHMVLAAFEHAAQGQSLADRRHRVEHVLGISDQQIQQMKQLGLIASIQMDVPTTLMGDEKLALFYGREPRGSVGRWRDLLESGLHVAGSSDWPVGVNENVPGAPAGSPMRLIYQSVARPGLNGNPPLPWMADQAISVEQAIRLLTIDAAYSTFDETLRGSISPGKQADLVILSGSPLAVPVDDIPKIETWVTMIGGKVEWCAPGHNTLCPATDTTEPGPTPTIVIPPPPAVPTLSTTLPTAPAPAGASGQVTIPAGQPVAIAVLGPGSGDNAAYLWPARQAARLGVSDYGLVQGFSIYLAPFDDGCNEAQGEEAAKQIAAQPEFVGVVGSLCSAALRGALPVLNQAGIVVVSPGATGPAMPSLGSVVFNRTILDDNALAAGGLQFNFIDTLETTQQFYTSYEARVGGAPPEYRYFMAYGYDATQILLKAVAATATVRADGALVVDRAALAQAVRGTSGFAGVTGTISFDEQGNRIP